MAIDEGYQTGAGDGERFDNRPFDHPSRDYRGSTGFDSGPGSDLLERLNIDEEQLAQGLGWFSIGLGVAEIAATRALARWIGLRDSHRVLQVFGMREIVSGIGILTGSRRSAWLWSRVAGDAIDLGFLTSKLLSYRSNPNRTAAAAVAVLGVTALDVLCSQEYSRREGWIRPDGSIPLRRSIVIGKPPEEVYRFWRDLKNLPRFMYYLDSVQERDHRRSHWVAKSPAGGSIEWDAEIVEERPNELIAWRSLENADVEHAGSVRFERAPGGRGTLVRVDLEYNTPTGLIGVAAAKLMGTSPKQQIQEDLRRLKQLLEAGEIITTEGQPAARASGTSWKYDQTSRRSGDATSVQSGSLHPSPNGGAL